MNASALTVARSLKAHEILAALKRAIAERGIPGHIRSDNGPEFIAGITRQYLSGNGIKTLYIESESPWQNSHVESFHNRLRDECLNQEWFLSLAEARVVIENWRKKYNRIHTHSHLGFLSLNMFSKYLQQAKQTVLGSGQASMLKVQEGVTTMEESISTVPADMELSIEDESKSS